MFRRIPRRKRSFARDKEVPHAPKEKNEAERKEREPNRESATTAGIAGNNQYRNQPGNQTRQHHKCDDCSNVHDAPVFWESVGRARLGRMSGLPSYF
jgi:hypothetical protein